MGTSLKTMSKLLSPRLLSPISPKYLSVVNHQITRNVVREKLVAKKINFLESDTTNLTPVKIHISGTSEDEFKQVAKTDILINTPNKQKFIKGGIEDEKLFNILGKGSFGKVFKASYRGQTVAMKLVKKHRTYHREGNAIHLNHKNIVKTLEIIDNENIEGTFSLIIMEYFPNCNSLLNILNNPIIESELLKYVRDICEGVLYCHLNNVFHLDIKPSNILVCNGVCKLCDFGNSVNAFENFTSFVHQGTIQYTSPEILLGKAPTNKSDVYSLGVLFWQMKTRRCPYEEIDNIECIIYKVVKCNLRPNLEEPTDGFSRLYQQCWNQSPKDRPNVCDILKLLSTF